MATTGLTEHLGDSENLLSEHRMQPLGRKILVVDDCPQMRSQICELIMCPGDVIYECFDGEIAVNSYARLQPDLVLMDIEIEGIDGLRATREIVRQNPVARIIIVTQYRSTAFQLAARQAGAIAYVFKEDLAQLPQRIKQLTS